MPSGTRATPEIFEAERPDERPAEMRPHEGAIEMSSGRRQVSASGACDHRLFWHAAVERRRRALPANPRRLSEAGVPEAAGRSVAAAVKR